MSKVSFCARDNSLYLTRSKKSAGLRPQACCEGLQVLKSTVSKEVGAGGGSPYSKLGFLGKFFKMIDALSWANVKL